MASPLQINVCTLEGGQLELFLDRQATCAHLKDAIAKHANVPVIFQNLTIGAIVLKDVDLLEDHLENGAESELEVTLIKSMHEALRHLTIGTRQARQASLESVVALLPREVDMTSAQALCAALEDVDFHEETRAAALKVLARVAPPGDSSALKTLTKCVADRSVMVRSAAIQGLKSMLPEGSAAVVESLGAYASGRPPDVKLAALKAVCVAAPEDGGGEPTADSLKLFLRSSDEKVSQKAAKILTKMAERGNKYAAEVLSDQENFRRNPQEDFQIGMLNAIYSDILPFEQCGQKGYELLMDELM